jgi:hypothetical protein
MIVSKSFNNLLSAKQTQHEQVFGCDAPLLTAGLPKKWAPQGLRMVI